jgi:prepilin-type processing-associated H-X9-DG protein
LVAVEVVIDSYKPPDAYSFQSWSHRHGAGGDLHFLRNDSVQSCSHRRGVGGERHDRPSPGDGPHRSSSILSSPHRGGAYVVFADGHVEFLSDKIDPNVLKALTNATGGENLPAGSW